MGGVDFTQIAEGKSVEDAFTNAREQAQFDYGHAGYTGTIAEKHEFKVIERDPQSDEDASKRAYALIEDEDRRINDKWGPAGALRLEPATEGKERWLFFGIASC